MGLPVVRRTRSNSHIDLFRLDYTRRHIDVDTIHTFERIRQWQLPRHKFYLSYATHSKPTRLQGLEIGRPFPQRNEMWADFSFESWENDVSADIYQKAEIRIPPGRYAILSCVLFDLQSFKSHGISYFQSHVIITYKMFQSWYEK